MNISTLLWHYCPHFPFFCSSGTSYQHQLQLLYKVVHQRNNVQAISMKPPDHQIRAITVYQDYPLLSQWASNGVNPT